MTGQQLNYERIASAIRFIKENRREQPKLEDVAEHVNRCTQDRYYRVGSRKERTK